MLVAEPGVDVVAIVADLAELDADTLPDLVLRNDVRGASPPGTREHAFSDLDTFAALREAVRGGQLEQEPAVPRAADAAPVDHAPADPPRHLTPRELQVMHAVAEGLTTTQIAETLSVSRKAVEKHKERIFAKLGVQSSASAVLACRQAGLLRS